jgi:hypothetical protein
VVAVGVLGWIGVARTKRVAHCGRGGHRELVSSAAATMVASVVGLFGGLGGLVRLEPGVVATGMSCLGEAILEVGWRRLGAIESLSITYWGSHKLEPERCPAESSPGSLMSPAGKAP